MEKGIKIFYLFYNHDFKNEFSFRIPIMEIAQCFHNTVIKEMCADCGADLQHLEVTKQICDLDCYIDE